ncbi:outer dense fiber protein 3B-like, partial [Ceratina calcarata]|uniref:Outer dense fiber protein 3B-like n=1 Tax=Ceratina calcarata TaxID=156304 RepID=A0AAJ7J477_9HYME
MGGMTQRPWTPTKRRGPIAAEYSSPGPACVTLPPLIGKTVPDSKRGRAPAFSFGSRHAAKMDSPGPGPGQYNVSGLSAKGEIIFKTSHSIITDFMHLVHLSF